jgi:hypothetical protein
MFYLPHRSHVDHLVKNIIGMSALLYNNKNSCCHCNNPFCFHYIMSFHSAKFDFQHYVLHYLHLIYREEGKRHTQICIHTHHGCKQKNGNIVGHELIVGLYNSCCVIVGNIVYSIKKMLSTRLVKL